MKTETMPTPKARILLLLLLPLALPALGGGCAGKRFPAGKEGGSPAGEDDVLDLAALAKRFWAVREEVKAGPAPRRPLLAIAEFTVEFAGEAGAPGEASGADFGTGMKVELPDVLYQGFLDTLPEFDREPVAHERVVHSQAHERLVGVSHAEAGLTSGSRYPAGGLLVLDPAARENDAALLALVEELGADGVLQVRLRVGVRDGRASIEKGSSFRAFGLEGRLVLESELTLLSPYVVTVEGGAVDSRRFVTAIRRLFRPYIGMALVAAGRAE